MNEPIKREVLEKMLLRIIKLKYPSVVEINITHLFMPQYSTYYVSIGVPRIDWKKDYPTGSEIIPYVNNLCKYLVARPDVMKVNKIYTSDPLSLNLSGSGRL